MKRLEKLQSIMSREGVDLVALGPGAHMKWLLGFAPHPDERPCLVCVTRTDAAFLLPGLSAEEARAHFGLPLFIWSDDEGPFEAFETLLEHLEAKQAATLVLDETMRADFAALVQDAVPSAERRFTGTTVGALRMYKDNSEVTRLQENAAIADQAMQIGHSLLKPGVTEAEIAIAIQEEFSRLGAKPLFSIVAAGPNGAFPHHQTGETVLRAGDAIVIDIGGGKDDYSSDITRMAVIGDGPEGYDEVHAIVESAVQAALAAARPGVKAHEVDDAARSVIAKAGYGEYFVHRTGHGMGVEIHEPPFITASSQSILQPGMVFSIEPGVYLPGRFGIRLEDIVVLREDGPEILSSLPRDVVKV